MKKKLVINTGSSRSEIYVGESLKNISDYAAGRNTVIVTDTTVYSLYGSIFKDYKKIVIGEGEDNKTLPTLEYIYEKLISFSADRNTLLIGVGGGIVSDITGFAASTFMRGIPYGFVSTTLLSQVDAGVGGKNGINFNNIKNMIGTINQPEFVIADTSLLKTLPEKEIISGMGELVKHVFLDGNDAENVLESVIGNEFIPSELAEKEKESLDELILSSLKVKASVVADDEKEQGRRRLLNLGHTLGHAVEIAENIPHGMAVIKGIIFTVQFSVKKGFIAENEAERITAILKRILPEHEVTADRKQLKEIILHDKKREDSSIYFVFLKGIGRPVIEKIEINDLLEALDDLCIGR